MRLTRSILLGSTLLCVATSAGLADETKSDVPRIKIQMVEHLCNIQQIRDAREPKKPEVGKPSAFSSPQPGNAPQWVKTLKQDGTWADINYADQSGGSWSPGIHLGRVLDIARNYANPAHPLHGDAALHKAIHSALGYWLEKDYRCPNWWHNQIGVPRNMASILLLIENELSPQEKADGLKIVARAKIDMTGQNRLWLAEITLMRGLLENDAALVQNARDVILSEIIVTTKEGLQPDNSFHQHGPQLQLGNYGLAFATDSAEWAEILKGTSLALDESKMALVRNYLLEGERYVFWKGVMDISACGRQIFPGSPASKCRNYIQSLQFMQRADPDNSSQYEEAIASSSANSANRNAFVANKHFWRSDYMVDRRPDYYASVRMSSRRVVGSELINGENKQGFYLGDGALYLYQDGREYDEIFPIWDWRKLPGITAAQTERDLSPTNRPIDGDFVGGVSDGHNGAAAFDYKREGVAAKKSWFFFKGHIVCLGADITSDKDAPVVTSLNQCLLKNDVVVCQENAAPATVTGRKEYLALKWTWHDGVGYFLTAPAKVTVGGATQEGSWKAVFSAGSADPVKKDVFAMWFDHGIKPGKAAYSYVILPSVSAEQMQAYAKKPDVEVLSNTGDLQAAKCGGIAMAVFYKPGQLSYAPGKQITVDQPCLVMVQESAPGVKLMVADPTQKLEKVNIVLNGKPAEIQLPQGAKAGSSVAVP